MTFYIGVYAYAILVHTRVDQLLPHLSMEQFDNLPVQCGHDLNISMKKFGLKNNFGQNDSYENLDKFSLIFIDRAFMGRSSPTTALMEQFDLLPIRCRHIEHMHEGVWIEKMNLDKITAMRT